MLLVERYANIVGSFLVGMFVYSLITDTNIRETFGDYGVVLYIVGLFACMGIIMYNTMRLIYGKDSELFVDN